MSEGHVNCVLQVVEKFYQGFCSCGWVSTVQGYEEVDLLRAIHAHEFAVFRSEK